MDVVQHNSMAWDSVNKDELAKWQQPVSSEMIARAKENIAEVLLTSTTPVPSEWYMPVKGKRILCLACGGGQQAPLFAAMGADVTVIDNSEGQLQKDRQVAEENHLTITLIKGDMCDLSIFQDETFDMIFHPISNCFIADPQPVWEACYRVLKRGGHLLAGFLNPVFYLFNLEDMEQGKLNITNTIPYSDLEQLPKDHLERRIANKDTLEYGHTLESLIGGQTVAGVAITAFYEDISSDELIDKHIKTCIATKAIKL